jgi:D-alanyl-lipoteichoic acid acyltransferase DltB (MBOAT superfamily)
MLFNSPAYIFIFLPLVVAGYFFLNRYSLGTLSRIWLLIASLFFYAYWNPAYLPLILTSIVVNYAVGTRVARRARAELADNALSPQSRHLLGLGILFNLALLAYFKYADFFVDNVNLALGLEIVPLHLVLPLAISFFTFQQIAYLVDCYRLKVDDYKFLNYCIFVTFFPQLIAGPIVHHRQMMPQFDSRWRKLPRLRNISQGCFIFSLGLFKKVFIADAFAIWADQGFAAEHALGPIDAWATSLSYTFQLYFDFSAYSDMAIGAALLFNIRLPVNFNSPYKAADIRDFWRRWHISLSTWLRDYLYIPLGGSRRAAGRLYINLLITFLLGGLWHGAGWNFLIWGGMHGGAVMLHRRWKSCGFRMPTWLGWASTFLFVNCTWVLFRAENFDQAVRLLASMFFLSGPQISLDHAWQNPQIAYWAPEPIIGWFLVFYLLLFGFVAFKMPNALQVSGYIPYSGRFAFRRGAIAAVFIALSLFYALVAPITSVPSPFIYFNF